MKIAETGSGGLLAPPVFSLPITVRLCFCPVRHVRVISAACARGSVRAYGRDAFHAELGLIYQAFLSYRFWGVRKSLLTSHAVPHLAGF